jgi:hypothetical protein
VKNLPNPSVSLVGQDGRPTSPLLDMLPQLSAVDVVVDRQGLPTPLFLTRLRGAVEQPLPNARAQIVHGDGTPTRVFTALLAALP